MRPFLCATNSLQWLDNRYSLLRESLQTTVLKSSRDLRRLDLFGCFQVAYPPRDFKDPRVEAAGIYLPSFRLAG
jgi:hypothetical protein